MPAKRRLTMRQLRQMLRLAGSGTSSREIAVVLGIAASTVQDNLRRAAAIGLRWPLPGELTDDALENKLFARNSVKQGTLRRTEPNWADLTVELKKPGVTLLILWEEYRGSHPDGCGYSRFASSFAASNSGFPRRCARSMRPATRSSSTIPARRSRLLIARSVRSATQRSSSRCSAHPASPMPKQHGHKHFPTGSAPMGRVRQAPVRRSRTGPRLSGPLHPSRRHRQQPPREPGPGKGQLPLEGLSPPRQVQAQAHDLKRRPVHPRFLLHALPDGFHRTRHYSLLANGHRVAKLAQCRLLLAAPSR